MRPEVPLQAHHFEALGTNCSLFAAGRSHGSLVEGEFWVRRLGARLTRFSSDSELSRLNARAGEWVEISADLETLLRASLRAFEMSTGLVNVAVLPSMLAIGYTRPLMEGAVIATLDAAGPLPALPAALQGLDGLARVARASGIGLGGLAKGCMTAR